jgi:hypothetical protein
MFIDRCLRLTLLNVAFTVTSLGSVARSGVQGRQVQRRWPQGRIGVGSGGEETVRQSSDANRDGVDQDGRPEGLAGPAAEEVLERTPWQRRPRGALELCAAGVELGFRVWNGGVLRAGDVLVPSDADVLCDLLSTLETMYEGPRLPKGVSLRFDVADDAVVCIDFTGKTDNADSCMTFYICDAYVPYTIARRPHASPPANVSSVARDAIEGLLHYLFRKPSFLGLFGRICGSKRGGTGSAGSPGPLPGASFPSRPRGRTCAPNQRAK